MNLNVMGYRGNRKLGKGNIAYLSLPADPLVCGRTCPGCYAKRIFPNVSKRRWAVYYASMSDDFPQMMQEDLNKLKGKGVKYIRIHDSGDFYSDEYVKVIYEIAKSNPDLIFYAYTKRIGQFKGLEELAALPNFILIDSLKYGINYGDDDVVNIWQDKGAHVCQYRQGGISCGYNCTYCMTKEAQKKGVVFHKH